jgi:hypothetical protein
MHPIHTNAHSLAVDMRPDGKHTREVFVDEDIECSASPMLTSIELLDQPGGTPATINGTTIVCHEVGRHLFKATFSDGKSAHLHIVACERACLDRIPGLNRGRIVNPSANPKPPERTFAEQCLILRSLCHAPGFDGSAASIAFDKVGSLANHGG